MSILNERAIRCIIQQAFDAYAAGFSDRHISEYEDEEDAINMKKRNVFIAASGRGIQDYSALDRLLDSSMGNMLEGMAKHIAMLNYEVSRKVEGPIYKEQTDYIAELLESYKNTRGANHRIPQVSDYKQKLITMRSSDLHSKRHEGGYYLWDVETGKHYLIELQNREDSDNKKARSEKEALLEQYCILANSLGTDDNVSIYFATAYNRYGEGNYWKQGRVRQFSADDELLISSKFWNLICKDENGYNIVMDELHCVANMYA